MAGLRSLNCYQKSVRGAFVRFSKLYHGLFGQPTVSHFPVLRRENGKSPTNTREERPGIDWAITEVDSKAIK